MPLILEDRCFLLEYHDDQDMFTVFTLVNGKPVLEIGSSIFGLIKGEETEIRVSDREIRYRGSVLRSNTFMGIPVGIHIRKDGSMAIGVTFPPEFLALISGGGGWG